MTVREDLDRALVWLDDLRESIGEGPDEHNEMACQALAEAEEDLFRIAASMEGDNCSVCYTIKTSARAAMSLEELLLLSVYDSQDDAEKAFDIMYERKGELLAVIETLARKEEE